MKPFPAGNPRGQILMHLAHCYESPIGTIVITSDGTCITSLDFSERPVEEQEESSIFDAADRWLDTYFEGEDPGPIPPVKMEGTNYRMEIWHILCSIPYGRTVSYGDVARMYCRITGKTKMSSQAVGNAVGHNPVAIMVPCHRVIGSDGSLTGYAGGLERKRFLLDLESKH